MSLHRDDFDLLPRELRDAIRYVVWRFEDRGNGPTKVPYRANGRGRARSNDPATCATFDAALKAANNGAFDGIGVMFAEGEGHVGVDLDDCRSPIDGSLARWAVPILSSLDTYAETSPSGTGVKLWCRGPRPPTRPGTKGTGRRSRKLDGKMLPGDGAVEVYTHGRLFCLTGRKLDGKPSALVDCSDALATLYKRLPGVTPPTRAARPLPAHQATPDDELLIRRLCRCPRRAALWRGDIGRYGSASEADLALCSHLAYWTGGDAGRIDRLFRESSLMRDKWDRGDYRAATINAALKGCQNTYTPLADDEPLMSSFDRLAANAKSKEAA